MPIALPVNEASGRLDAPWMTACEQFSSSQSPGYDLLNARHACRGLKREVGSADCTLDGVRKRPERRPMGGRALVRNGAKEYGALPTVDRGARRSYR